LPQTETELTALRQFVVRGTRLSGGFEVGLAIRSCGWPRRVEANEK
jgi:hypothetical protein